MGGAERFPVELYGKYYYRDANYAFVRITIAAKSEKPGFYLCVNGHWTEAEVMEKGLEPFLIHINRIPL